MGSRPGSRVAARCLAVLAVANGLRAQTVEGASLGDVVAAAERAGWTTGVVVRELQTGRIRYAHRSDRPFIPASNQKLVTVAAALWGLGAEFRFATRFALVGGVLEVHGGGDPNWLHGTPHAAEQVFDRVASALRERGVTALRGVRLVSGVFTGPARPVGWPSDQLDRDYCAPTGALVLEAGCFTARITPTPTRARVELLAPRADLEFEPGLRVTDRVKKRYAYWLAQSGKRLTSHGEIGAHLPPVEVVGVSQDPEWLFEQSLWWSLKQRGITQRDDAAAVDGAVWTEHSGLTEAIPAILRESSNFHAEQLLRVCGARLGDGSFAGGCHAVRDQIGRHVAVPSSLVVVDGSGLSRDNRVTPGFLVELLRTLCSGPSGRLVLESLARGGVDGTLRNRFKRRRELGRSVRAKTGTIRGVKALTGVVEAPDRTVCLFSILMNGAGKRGHPSAGELQERMVAAIHAGR
ncbi:MAG: D-alanyl-D-alanine carboxypeptidase/D-alanyl-D-alanine-endopeptidase [Planctomycetes bacterium]|nr:D-alanyl-D-alanine carboxypeptidase/D-alanyl-D-alanine-endopeptidase [Planctomycetota bacterium]